MDTDKGHPAFQIVLISPDNLRKEKGVWIENSGSLETAVSFSQQKMTPEPQILLKMVWPNLCLAVTQTWAMAPGPYTSAKWLWPNYKSLRDPYYSFVK